MGCFLYDLRTYRYGSRRKSEARSEHGIRIVTVGVGIALVLIKTQCSRIRAGSSVEKDFPTAGGIVRKDSEIVVPCNSDSRRRVTFRHGESPSRKYAVVRLVASVPLPSRNGADEVPVYVEGGERGGDVRSDIADLADEKPLVVSIGDSKRFGSGRPEIIDHESRSGGVTARELDFSTFVSGRVLPVQAYYAASVCGIPDSDHKYGARGPDVYGTAVDGERRQFRSEIREIRNHRIPVGFLQLIAGIDRKERGICRISYGKGANRREKRDSRENGFFEIGEFHKKRRIMFPVSDYTNYYLVRKSVFALCDSRNADRISA